MFGDYTPEHLRFFGRGIDEAMKYGGKRATRFKKRRRICEVQGMRTTSDSETPARSLRISMKPMKGITSRP